MSQEEKILEFDKIKQLWLEYAFTKKAKERIEEAVPFLSERELLAGLRETTESRQLLEKCGEPPLVSLNGMEEILLIAGKGDCLSAGQLECVRSGLVAVRRLKDYLERGKAYDNSLAWYAENLDDLEALKEEINAAVYNEEVADSASPQLQNIRRQLKYSEEKMREKAEAAIRSNKECMSDSFATFRNGHICIPVKKEYKFRISGSVIDKSATGNTLFIEPAASAKYYEELEQLRIAQEDEVRRILYTLTVQVDSFAEPLRQNICTMEKLDFAFAKGKLSLSYDGVSPAIISERAIRLTDARHPLLERRTCVPLQFEIGSGTNGIVITGPNTGGKTVALKTVALCCMMAQCGLHVPCGKAEICMCSNFLCDIGDGQNLSENLSTFSAHIKNVLDILERVNPESLVIMDELGSGTDPQEGMGIAVAILEELKKSGSLFLVTTHYPEIKTYAQQAEGILNAKMAFDAENLKPLYKMVIGEAGESCALHIAKRLGMPGNMLRRAMEASYGGEVRKLPEGTRELRNLPKGALELRKLLDGVPEELERAPSACIAKQKAPKKKKEIPFHRGDSVMVYPDKKVGIVCQEANEKGVLRVQLPDRKIWINHKRVKLLVAAESLYPEDYDFTIVFETAENRKMSHNMERKYVEGAEIRYEE